MAFARWWVLDLLDCRRGLSNAMPAPDGWQLGASYIYTAVGDCSRMSPSGALSYTHHSCRSLQQPRAVRMPWHRQATWFLVPSWERPGQDKS